MQRKASAYLVKRLGDELFAKPAAPDEPTKPDADLDGQLIHDEEGRAVGTAHRLRHVAVYVVSDGYGKPDDELARCLKESDSEVMFQTDGGRITALIYVPDPSRAPRRPEAMRADEV